MALCAGDGADAVADPFEGLGGEAAFVHPVEGELETRDPYPGGYVGVAGVTGSDCGELSVDEDDRTCHGSRHSEKY